MITGVLHALCNAHYLRELKALIEIEKEDWAPKIQRLLRRACHATNLAREQGVSLKPGLIALIDRCYDLIVVKGLLFHEAQPELAKAGRRGRQPRRVGHNFLLRLITPSRTCSAFWRFPLSRRCKEFCHHSPRSLDGKEAGLEYAPDLDRRPDTPDGSYSIDLITALPPGQ